MDAIWDEPVLPRSPRRLHPRSLSPPNTVPVSNTEQSELDAMFADIGDISEVPGPSSRPSQKSGSSGASRPKRRVTNVLMSDGEDDDASKEGSKGKGDDKDDKDKKKRRPIVKLDEERLLGPNGFPALVAQHKRFKPAGKGNETKDLQRLLQMYQLWAHKMYPKTQFRDTSEKIEKQCRSRRMHAALSGWRDEPHKASAETEGDTQPINPDVEAAGENDSPEPTSSAAQASPQDRGKGKAPARETPARSAQVPDEWDLDAMIAEDEATRTGLGFDYTSTPQASTSAPTPIAADTMQKPPPPIHPEEDEWDMDALIAEVERQEELEIPAVEQDAHPGDRSGANGSDDEDMWDIVRSMDVDDGMGL